MNMGKELLIVLRAYFKIGVCFMLELTRAKRRNLNCIKDILEEVLLF